VFCVVFFSTWLTIVAQYKDFKKSQESRLLLATLQQCCRQPHFLSEIQSLPCIFLRLNKYSKISNSLIVFGSNRIVTNYSVQSEILNINTALISGVVYIFQVVSSVVRMVISRGIVQMVMVGHKVTLCVCRAY